MPSIHRLESIVQAQGSNPAVGILQSSRRRRDPARIAGARHLEFAVCARRTPAVGRVDHVKSCTTSREGGRRRPASHRRANVRSTSTFFEPLIIIKQGLSDTRECACIKENTNSKIGPFGGGKAKEKIKPYQSAPNFFQMGPRSTIVSVRRRRTTS